MTYPLSFTLTVEPRHAGLGAQQGSSCYCPAANALLETFPNIPTDILGPNLGVTAIYVRVERTFYTVPPELASAISQYDETGVFPYGTFILVQEEANV